MTEYNKKFTERRGIQITPGFLSPAVEIYVISLHKLVQDQIKSDLRVCPFQNHVFGQEAQTLSGSSKNYRRRRRVKVLHRSWVLHILWSDASKVNQEMR